MIIPQPLIDTPQWIFWRWDTRDGKVTKVPCDVRGNDRAVTKPSSWVAHADAVEQYALHADILAGYGFCFTKADPYFGGDLDGCLPNLSAMAEEILGRFPTYSEVSPSGTGIKFIGIGQKPEGAGAATIHVEGFKKLELYDHSRFFTVTGNLWGLETELVECQEGVEWLCARFFPPKSTPVTSTQPTALQGASSLLERAAGFEAEDEELVAYLREDPKYDRLWRGDKSDYATPEKPEGDWSSADGALVEKIAWLVGPFPERIDRIFRASGLFREEKWDRRGDDYGERTIRFALSSKNDFYRGPGGSVPEPEQAPVDLVTPYSLADLTTIEAQRVTWHVKDFVPKGMAVLLSSAGGVIKGLYTMWLAANHIDGPVLYLGSEDNLAMIIKPRAQAAGMDLTRFKPRLMINLQDGVKVPPRFPVHASILEQAILDTSARLVVIDAGPEHLQEGLKNNSVEDIRRFMTPLNDIAERLNITILVIQHNNKTQGATGTDRVGGSRAWVDAQRHVLTAAIDDEDDDVRHVQVTKSNIGKMGIGRQFRVLTTQVPVRDRDTGEWINEEIPYIIDEGISTKDVEALLSVKKKEKDTTLDKAILDYLNGGTGGKRDSVDCDKSVEILTGNTERTCRNHRIALGKRGFVDSFREESPDGKIQKWESRITNTGMEYLASLKEDPNDEWRNL